MIKIKSDSLENLNKIRVVLNTRIPSYRINEIQVVSYNSLTSIELFVNRLSYLPIGSIPSLDEWYTIKSEEGIYTGKIFNSQLPGIKTIETINILNEGSFEVKIKFKVGIGLQHSRYNIFEKMEWDEENKTITLFPTIEVDPSHETEIKNKLNHLKIENIEFT